MSHEDARPGRGALKQVIRADIQSGALLPGAPLPSLRQLSERFGVPRSAVQAELRPLISEGLLQVKPRHGIFVAANRPAAADTWFVFAAPDPEPQVGPWLHVQLARRGFERRIGELGGTTALLRPPDDHGIALAPPEVSGVFHFLADPGALPSDMRSAGPAVYFGYPGEYGPAVESGSDCVHFNDLDGGRRATQHLIRRGYSRIAFMAAHHAQTPAHRTWSRDRQAGWQAAMTDAFPDATLRSFHPTEDERAAAGDTRDIGPVVARRMLRDRACFDAVVGADDTYILGLVRELRAAGIPTEEWPAMVGFEGLPESGSYVLTSIVPPWERLGEAAADVLWARVNGQLQGPPAERLVTMNVVSRLTSRPARRPAVAAPPSPQASALTQVGAQT